MAVNRRYRAKTTVTFDFEQPTDRVYDPMEIWRLKRAIQKMLVSKGCSLIFFSNTEVTDFDELQERTEPDPPEAMMKTRFDF